MSHLGLNHLCGVRCHENKLVLRASPSSCAHLLTVSKMTGLQDLRDVPMGVRRHKWAVRGHAHGRSTADIPVDIHGCPRTSLNCLFCAFCAHVCPSASVLSIFCQCHYFVYICPRTSTTGAHASSADLFHRRTPVYVGYGRLTPTEAHGRPSLRPSTSGTLTRQPTVFPSAHSYIFAIENYSWLHV